MIDKIQQLTDLGLLNWKALHWNNCASKLIEKALIRNEGSLACNGALMVNTGKRTGRSPLDRFFVEEPASREEIAWGKINLPMSEASFGHLFAKIQSHFQGKELFIEDLFVGVDQKYRLPIRVISEHAWGGLFAHTLFVRPNSLAEIENHSPRFTVLHAPNLITDPQQDGTRSDVFVSIHLQKGLILIGGTGYGGEIKKSIFTVMNYVLPLKGVLSMHCSANIGKQGDVALFFGLSGTGKTSLSADPHRQLIGDDEHGWSEEGVFNYEGGCYAKAISLSREKEPQIYNAIKFGSIAENVIYDEKTRVIDYDNAEITENTRATYPVEFIDNVVIPGQGGHPNNIMFLTADAFGVLPPISRLTPEMAMYHFMSGYTSKLAGTEAGIEEPQATFSACFGEPFMPLPIERYAQMLGEKMKQHQVNVWLINTGWSGGPYGIGKRVDIGYTRAMIKAAISGELNEVEFKPHPIFKILVPLSCGKEVPSRILNPRNTWEDKAAYDQAALELAKRFVNNFRRFPNAGEEIRAAGPLVD